MATSAENLETHATTEEHSGESSHTTGIHVELAPETLVSVGGFPITNTLLTSWVAIAILFTIAILVGKNLKMVPGRLQTAFEALLILYLLRWSKFWKAKNSHGGFFHLL